MSDDLPIPHFERVREVSGTADSIVLIVPATTGAPPKFDVIRIMVQTGKARCIGRELSIGMARRVGDRDWRSDGRPLR
jgi:hypothetical protein